MSQVKHNNWEIPMKRNDGAYVADVARTVAYVMRPLDATRPSETALVWGVGDRACVERVARTLSEVHGLTCTIEHTASASSIVVDLMSGCVVGDDAERERLIAAEVADVTRTLSAEMGSWEASARGAHARLSEAEDEEHRWASAQTIAYLRWRAAQMDPPEMEPPPGWEGRATERARREGVILPNIVVRRAIASCGQLRIRVHLHSWPTRPGIRGEWSWWRDTMREAMGVARQLERVIASGHASDEVGGDRRSPQSIDYYGSMYRPNSLTT